MATIRKLSDNDVRAIFESLHGNVPPPPHLPFKIYRSGPQTQNKSPPSYEFEGKNRSVASHILVPDLDLWPTAPCRFLLLRSTLFFFLSL